MISRLLAALLLLLPAGCGQGPEAPAPADARVEGLGQVVAGTGSVSAAQIADVAQIVRAETVRLAKTFDGAPSRPFFVHVHADRASMPEALTAFLHADSPGFALLGTHQIHLVWDEIRRSGSSLHGVVVHELVHELLDQYVAPNGRLIPRWFHEGLAQTIAGDTYLGAREEDLVWRLMAGQLESFGSLRERFPTGENDLRTAYAQSYSYVAWLAREHGLPALLRIARDADNVTSFEAALSGRLRRSGQELRTGWEQHVLRHSGAPWRVVLDQCFSYLIILALPVLVLALMRRLRAEQRAASRLRDEPPPADVPSIDPPIGSPTDPPTEPPPGDPRDAPAGQS